MTTTERRLAITPGDWKHIPELNEGTRMYIRAGAGYPAMVPGGFMEDMARANAELIADAGTTANACDMLPSELLAKLREAAKLMNAVLKEYNEPDVMNRTPICYFKKFSAMERFVANLPK